MVQLEHPNRLLAGTGLSHENHILLAADHRGETLAQDRVVVDSKNANYLGFRHGFYEES